MSLGYINKKTKYKDTIYGEKDRFNKLEQDSKERTIARMKEDENKRGY
jgi:hypothetical protein